MQTTRLRNSMGYIESDGLTDGQTHRRTDTQTGRQTDTQTDMTENITYPHTRVVKIRSYWSCVQTKRKRTRKRKFSLAP